MWYINFWLISHNIDSISFLFNVTIVFFYFEWITSRNLIFLFTSYYFCISRDCDMNWSAGKYDDSWSFVFKAPYSTWRWLCSFGMKRWDFFCKHLGYKLFLFLNYCFMPMWFLIILKIHPYNDSLPCMLHFLTWTSSNLHM